MATLLDRPYRVLCLFIGIHAALALLFVLYDASGSGASWRGLPLDDAWIHLVYARGLVEHGVFAYNGAQAEAGFTSPLWVVLLAPVVAVCSQLGVNTVLGAKALGVATGVLLSWVAYRSACALSGRASAGLFAGVLVALEPSLCFAQVSGMEVALSATCCLVAVLGVVRLRWDTVAAGLALAVLSRPENAIAACVFGVMISWGVLRRRFPPRALAAIGAPLAAGAGWSLYCVLVTGRLLPNTYYAKAQMQASGAIVSNVWKAVAALGALPVFTGGVGAVLAVVGVRHVLRSQEQTRRVAVLVMGAYPVCLLAGVVLTRALPEWQPFYWNRYLQPAWPPLLCLAAIGADVVRRFLWSPAKNEGRDTRIVLGAGVALFCTLLGFRAISAFSGQLTRYSWNCQNIEEMQVSVARWLRDRTGPRDVIASGDAGAIRFVTGRRVIDLVGLNDHRVLRGGPGEVIAAEAPQYFVVFPAWFPGILSNPRYEVVHRVRAERYTICDCPQDELVVLRRVARGTA